MSNNLLPMSTKTTPLIVSLLLVLLSACHHDDTFTIQGTLEGGAGKTVYIEELTPSEPLFLDSIRLDNEGKFSYSCKLPYATFYNLHVTPTNYVMLLPEGGDKIVLSGQYDNLEGTYEVRGSYGTMLLWQLQSYSNMGSEKLSEIVSIDQQNRQTYATDTAAYRMAKQVTDSMYYEAYTEQSDYIKKFINDNQGSLATLIALYKPFGRSHALIDIERDPGLLVYYEQVLEGLEQSHPDNPHTMHFKNSVAYLQHRLEQYQQQQQQDLSISVGDQ